MADRKFSFTHLFSSRNSVLLAVTCAVTEVALSVTKAARSKALMRANQRTRELSNNFPSYKNDGSKSLAAEPFFLSEIRPTPAGAVFIGGFEMQYSRFDINDYFSVERFVRACSTAR